MAMVQSTLSRCRVWVISRWKRVPLITWEQAGKSNKFDTAKAEKWMWTDVECGSRTFALVIQDDSMMPRYEPGATVILILIINRSIGVLLFFDGKKKEMLAVRNCCLMVQINI